MAAIQVDACTPNFLIQEGGYFPWYDSVLKEPFPGQSDGFFDLPTKPGIGLAIDENALKEHPAGAVTLPGGYRGGYQIESRQQNHWV